MMLGDTPNLESPEAKFGWAKKYADRLREEISTVLSDGTYKLRVERDEQASQYVFHVERMPLIDPDWGLIFGDAIHNFRSALDHLAVQLAILGKGVALTEDEAEHTSFPILEDPDRWKQVAGPRAVSLMRSGERERIRELQPFNSHDPSIWGQWPAIPARPPLILNILARTDNLDKHRFVHPTWYAPAPGGGLPPLPGIRSGSTGGRLETNEEVGSWHFDGPPPDLPGDLDVESYFPPEVAFAEPSFTHPMLLLLDDVERIVGGIVDLFREPLTTGDPAPPVTRLL